jgi:pilus assembly protein Flp/PilA
MKGIRRWAASDSGTTAIEYALIAGAISIVILVAVTNIGSSVTAMFEGLLAGF